MCTITILPVEMLMSQTCMLLLMLMGKLMFFRMIFSRSIIVTSVVFSSIEIRYSYTTKADAQAENKRKIGTNNQNTCLERRKAQIILVKFFSDYNQVFSALPVDGGVECVVRGHAVKSVDRNTIVGEKRNYTFTINISTLEHVR